MYLSSAFLAVLCLAFTALAQGPRTAAVPAARVSALDKATLEQYVRHLFVWGPQIDVAVSDPKPSKLTGFQEFTVTASAGNASQQETFLVSPDGRKIVRGTVLDVAEDPFAADAARIRTENEPSLGPATAPVTLVIYSDFQCGFCREEARVLRQNLTGTYAKDVRVIFKDYPLEQIHPWAKPASIAGRCIFRQSPAAFWDFHDWIFDKQSEITPENLQAKTVEFAKSKSLEPLQLGTCIESRLTEADVARTLAEGRTLGVNSTPTMFINGRRLVGQLGWPQLKQVIDHEIEYRKTQGAGKDCCSVTLPSPPAK